MRRLGATFARGILVAAGVAVLLGAFLGAEVSPARAQLGFGGAGAGAGAGAGPVAPVVAATTFERRNINALSDAEIEAYRDAVFRLMERTGTSAGATYQQYIDIHNGASRHGHSGPAFGAWHRAFLVDFEKDLGVAIPYWNWTERTPKLFTNLLFGGKGTPRGSGTEHDVTLTWTGADGTAKQYQFIREVRDTGLASLADFVPVPATSRDWLGMLRRTDFLTFTDEFEAIHGQPHVDVSGDLGYPPTAVKDPLFFVLHSFVDKIYWEWQQRQKATWEAANPGRTYDYATHYWDGRGAGGAAWNTMIRTHHQIDSDMWPWSGTSHDGTARGITIDKYRGARAVSRTPRMVLDASTLGYVYR